MYTIEEYDKQKSRVLKYVLYKKRSKQEVKNKFYNDIEENMLEDIICELEENGYINDTNYIERAVNGLSMKNPGWSIDVLLIADLVMEYIGKNNVSVDQVELSLVNGCLGINGILVERVALLPGINVQVPSKADDLEDRFLAREETI